MKEIYQKINEILTNCQENRESFSVPDFEGVEKKEIENERRGSSLYDRTFILTKENKKIEIQDICKDMCRTFQVEPDRNFVNLKYFEDDNLVVENSFIWDDIM